MQKPPKLLYNLKNLPTRFCSNRKTVSLYKLVIFDLDGTILNTIEDLADSVNFALKQNSLSPRSVEEVRSFVGNGIQNLLVRSVCAAKNIPVLEGPSCAPYFDESTNKSEKSLFTQLLDRVHFCFTEYYKIHCIDKSRPYKGILELLQNLRSKGFKTAVVSNKADYGVQQLCAQFFPNLFDFALGERNGIKRKPEPDSVFAVMKKFGISKSNTVYIGDSDVDIQTAHNAGIKCISVSWGFRSKQFLQEHGADIIIENTEEFWNALNKVFVTI